jgi:hypothetical protein
MSIRFKAGGRRLLREGILEAVEDQLRKGTPPETRETLARLRAEGYSRSEAVRLIGAVVAAEILDIVKTNEPFDERRFVAGLKRLPELPS